MGDSRLNSFGGYISLPCKPPILQYKTHTSLNNILKQGIIISHPHAHHHTLKNTHNKHLNEINSQDDNKEPAFARLIFICHFPQK